MTKLSLLLVCAASIAFGQASIFADGEVRKSGDGDSEAWDSVSAEWVTLDNFWRRYAERRGGLTWGIRSSYPPYDEVQELDTMIIEIDGRACMMMFFHTRWRRANDVRRWDDAFNEHSACPYVFD